MLRTSLSLSLFYYEARNKILRKVLSDEQGIKASQHRRGQSSVSLTSWKIAYLAEDKVSNQSEKIPACFDLSV